MGGGSSSPLTLLIMRILGYDYRIDLDKTMTQLGGNAGMCNLDSNVIQIGSDLPSIDVKSSVMLHEIIEAINYHLEIGLDERQVKCLEVGLHQVMKDGNVNLNPLMNTASGPHISL